MSNPQNISFSLMDTLTKDNGMKETLVYPSKILMLLQNTGEDWEALNIFNFSFYGNMKSLVSKLKIKMD